MPIDDVDSAAILRKRESFLAKESSLIMDSRCRDSPDGSPVKGGKTMKTLLFDFNFTVFMNRFKTHF